MQQEQSPVQGKLLVLGGVLVLGLRLMALPALVFLRKEFGVRFLTIPWIVGAFLVLQVVSAYTTDAGVWQAKQWEDAGFPLLPGMPYNGNAIALWGWISGAGMLLRWLQTKYREYWRGHHLHTYDTGVPVARRKVNISNWRRFMEPLMVALLAWAVYLHLDQPLGRWLFWTAAACGILEHLMWLAQRRRTWDISDPIYEQQTYAELVRDLMARGQRQDDPYTVSRPRKRWFG